MICPSCEHDNIPGEDLCDNCGMDLAGLDADAWEVDPDDPKLAVPLEKLRLKDPLTLGPRATVTEAIDLMKERHEGCVFVVDDAKDMIGVLTEHDVTARVAAPGRDPAQTRLEEVMTTQPVALQKGDPLTWALHRMGVDGYRHLPVLDEGKLVGFLSVRTVLRSLFEA